MKKFTLSIIVLVAGLFISLNLSSQNSNLANIDEFILEKMGTFHVPGLSAVIIKGDSVVWNNNYGYMNLQNNIPVNDSTLFSVFSIGKSITAACVMQLWDDGLLELDQNINDFLPFQLVNPWNSADSITARMLMSHSSSINNGNIYSYVSVGDPTIELGFFLENFLCTGGTYYSNGNYYNMQPGTTFHYDNYGVALNGYLVEPLTGISFSQYAQDSLLAKLEMDKSAWFLAELNVSNLATGYTWSGGNYTPVPHYGHPAYPGLSLRTTALELANYTIMLLNEGNFKGLTVLSDAAVDSMATLQNPNWNFSYGRPGLGLFKRTDYGDRTVWGHNGGSDGGYANHFYFCKEENSGIVITTNSEQYVDPIVLQLFEYAGLFTMAIPGTDITSSGFTANWEAATTATGYLLDVAMDDEFVNFVSGYENFNVGIGTNYAITGMEPETEYFYRLRAYNDADTGAYSNVISLTTFSNSCLPAGIIFTTQEQIDNFQINYPGCTEIEGNVTINGDDITNLNGFNVITSVGGDFGILFNESLISLSGLDNLNAIDGYLLIRSNELLTNLAGLENLDSISGNLYISGNASLNSLSGLESLTSIGGTLSIGNMNNLGGNPSLTSISGLESLTTIGGDLDIRYNTALTSLTGLNSLNFISGYLSIGNNDSLNNLVGLSNVTTIGGDVIIGGNDGLASLTGLENLTTIGGSLNIGDSDDFGGNSSLTNLAGLENLTSIGGSLGFLGNDTLTSLAGLDNLTSISGSLLIAGNYALTSLAGLDNLTAIGNSLIIGIEPNGYPVGNPALNSLEGLDNINAESISNLIIIHNQNLSTCDVQSVCDYLVAPNGNVYIIDNAPGCNSPEEVIEACAVLVDEMSLPESFSIFPNPANDQLTIQISLVKPEPVFITVLNVAGQQMAMVTDDQPKAGEYQAEIDISNWPAGVYCCKVQVGQETKTQKIIKVRH